MTDPATQTAAEAAAAAGVVITLTGSIFGMQFDAIMAGFVGALVAQTLVKDELDAALTPIRRYLRGFVQLVAAGLLAGLIAPVAEVIAASLLPVKIATMPLHIAVSGAIGMVAPAVVPVLRKLLGKFSEKP